MVLEGQAGPPGERRRRAEVLSLADVGREGDTVTGAVGRGRDRERDKQQAKREIDEHRERNRNRERE